MDELPDADIEVLNDSVTALRCAVNEIERLAEVGGKRECKRTIQLIENAVAACERMAGLRLPHCTNPNKAPQVQPTAVELEMRRSKKPAGDYKCEVLLNGKASEMHPVLAYWNGSTLHWGRDEVRISQSCKPRVISGPLVCLPMQWLESIACEKATP